MGVTRDKGNLASPWQATAGGNGTAAKYISSHKTEAAAARAYDARKRSLYAGSGKVIYVNFPRGPGEKKELDFRPLSRIQIATYGDKIDVGASSGNIFAKNQLFIRN